MAESQDVQKEQADANGRKNEHELKMGDLVLFIASNLPTRAVSAVYKTKLRPRFIGPFKAVSKNEGVVPARRRGEGSTAPELHIGSEGIQKDHGLMGHRPPPTLTDERGHQHFHFERLLARRLHQDHTQYLVKWRGYSQSYDSWKYKVPLRQDCLEVFKAFDREDQKLRQPSPDAS
ncbi:unnamed protein product [Peronospora belbahrii]|uniref:Chromo domain-containing protein n=1 Tax=Peronospora belbahrii TaxID=622444 RepID=A0AAU9KUY9_9STRA|nr:unnamed protein product [Peronospora belbahrii]